MSLNVDIAHPVAKNATRVGNRRFDRCRKNQNPHFSQNREKWGTLRITSLNNFYFFGRDSGGTMPAMR